MEGTAGPDTIAAPDPIPSSRILGVRLTRSNTEGKYLPLSASTLARLDPLRPRMGQVPDREIASLARVDRRYVVVYRQQYGIPAFDYRTAGSSTRSPKPAIPPTQHFRRSKLDGFRHLMGVINDGEVAQQAGTSREAVMRYRQRHQIPSAPRAVEPQITPIPVPNPQVETLPPVFEDIPDDVPAFDEIAHDPTPPLLIDAYMVTVHTNGISKDYVVTGPDIVSAVSHATRHVEVFHGEIRGVRHMGTAISA